MKSLDLHEAGTQLPAIVDAAAKGEPTIISRDGHPVAALVPIADAARLYPEVRPSFASMLTAIPAPLEIERDTSPFRDGDL
ncbi:MAG TPA: type II toxin-antitoxin system prevent-host-death family antitoxin [Afifellaceae bacterium]|nr:type II toxin-antitoxin system prevent-host-death family antitoxin [Afifellaceae bacterium]